MLNRFFANNVRRPAMRLLSTLSGNQQINVGDNVVAINPSVQVHKCDQNECYILMHRMREGDVFPESISKEKMIELFFPKTTSDMAESLSGVTSAFYGVMLQSTGKVIGMDNIDSVSQDFFYNLGKLKTKLTSDAVDGKYDLPKDARGVVILLVSAIYNASPEYRFDIKRFSEEHCEIELHGVDRYHRITRALGFEDKLQWPVLHRFMEGISDEMKADVDVKSEMLKINDSSECHERFTVTKRRP
jgi:hypothetical protein